MDTHSLPRVVSRPCSGHMHSACMDTECRCDCHQVCAACQSKCQATYDATEEIGMPFLVCADCYVTATKNRKVPRCEGCGTTTAYRDPAVGNFYLCMNCHQQHAIDTASPLAI